MTRHLENTKSCLLFLVMLVVLFTSFIAYALDSGPLLPPFPKNFDSIDCKSVRLNRVVDMNGMLQFEFSANPSIEYPPEYLPNFLKLETKTGNCSMSYSGEQIEKLQRNETNINITIYHTFAGPSVVGAKCLNHELQSFKLDISDVSHQNKKKEYSTSDFSPVDNAKFRDVCLEYEKFLYFIPFYGEHPSVPFDNDKFRFEMLKWPILNSYMDFKKVNYTDKTSFLMPTFPNEMWKTILVSLIPLAKSIQANEPNDPDKILIVFRNEVPQFAKSTLKYFTDNEPVKLDDIMCFETLLMTSSYSDNVQNKQILNALNNFVDDIPILRSKVQQMETNNNKVLIADDIIYNLIVDDLKENFPELQIDLLPKDIPFDEIVETVSDSFIFIGNHIKNLINMVWLNSNQSYVIDLSPKDYSCNPFFENVSKSLNINYIKYFNGKCDCSTFECYPQNPQIQKYDNDKIISHIKTILSSITNE